jgi:long-chain acyl-CoA synthetase
MSATASSESQPVKSITDFVKRHARGIPHAPAAKFKTAGGWQVLDWAEVAQRVARVAEGLIKLGVQPGDRVAIFAPTRVEWVIADLGILSAGAICVPIYSSFTADELGYILRDSGAVACFVDHDQPDGRQPGRLTRVRNAGTTSVKQVISFEPIGPGAMPFADLLATPADGGRAAERERREAALELTSTNSILYTSGTTGEPKGVVLTHGNWVYEAHCVREIDLMRPDETVLLFLPLAHSFARVTEAAWLSLGFCLAFAESTDKVVDNCADVRPTVFPAVPRIFEKVFTKVQVDGGAAPGLKGLLFRWALAQFEAEAAARESGRSGPIAYHLAKKLVLSKVAERLNARLGGRLRFFVSGSAPLSTKLAFFFQEVGLTILEGYGLTETAAGTCVNLPGRVKIGTVGPPMPGTELKIASDGEILIRGGGVMKSYYKLPEATAESLSADGWFATGDIGSIDPDGYLTITDRKKDLIATAGGKKVAPQKIENELRSYPIISQAMVSGDRRKFLSALLTVNEETARRIAAEHQLNPPDLAGLLASAPVREAVEGAVREVNAKLASFETVKRYAILPQDFTQDSGELTPSLKIKRKFATQKYKSVIDSLYDEAII